MPLTRTCLKARPPEQPPAEVNLIQHIFYLLIDPTFASLTTFLIYYLTEDVFFSMADMDMSHSLSSLPPLGDPPTVDLDLSVNSNYSASLGESPSGNVAVSHFILQRSLCFIRSVKGFFGAPLVLLLRYYLFP